MKFWNQAEELGLENSGDKDLEQFIFEFQTTGAKLAGALAGIARREGFRDSAFTVAYLKLALDHLHKSQAGFEAVGQKKVLPEAMVAAARKELFEIREGILHLMHEFRGRSVHRFSSTGSPATTSVAEPSVTFRRLTFTLPLAVSMGKVSPSAIV